LEQAFLKNVARGDAVESFEADWTKLHGIGREVRSCKDVSKSEDNEGTSQLAFDEAHFSFEDGHAGGFGSDERSS
jgi:hypothetical protein